MNLRILKVKVEDMIAGDKVLVMGIQKHHGEAFLMQPCKLQFETVDGFKNKVWVDIPFELGD